MKTKHSTAVGVFQSQAQAERAIADLRAAGFRDDQIGMVARDAESQDIVVTNVQEHTMAEEGAVAGVVAGAGVGSLIGLGIAAGVIPVVGPALALGTLGTMLLNAAGGAALAGVVGALVGFGIPEDDARWYEGEVQNGRYLVTCEAAGRYDEAWQILHRQGAYNKANPLGGRTVHVPVEHQEVIANSHKISGEDMGKDTPANAETWTKNV
jgi:hypothetical protein